MGNNPSSMWGSSPASPQLSLDSVITLHNGVTMPRLGFGVWQVDPSVCTSVCESALGAGYRHIDSAQAYRNEAEAGAALWSTPVERGDIFFTTKIPRDLGSVDANYASLVESVEKINGGGGGGDGGGDAYVDLFLIHTPRMGAEGIKNVWQALEKLLEEGKTRSIGVSNFNKTHIEGMKEYATVWPPHVNQIQVSSPYDLRYNGQIWCSDAGPATVEPLGAGKGHGPVLRRAGRCAPSLQPLGHRAKA